MTIARAILAVMAPHLPAFDASRPACVVAAENHPDNLRAIAKRKRKAAKRANDAAATSEGRAWAEASVESNDWRRRYDVARAGE